MVTLAESLPWSFGGYVPPDDLRELEGTNLAWIESHCDDGLALLLSQFRDKPRLAAMLCALLAGVQDLDDAVYQTLTERWLDTAVGVQLDQLGTIVDLPRRGWVDETYRTLLRAQVLVLRSEGTSVDLFGVLEAIGFTLSLTSAEEHPAAIVFTLGEPFGVQITEVEAFELLERAKPAGVRLDLQFPTTAVASSFTWADGEAEQADTARGWGNDAATTGGLWADVVSTEDA